MLVNENEVTSVELYKKTANHVSVISVAVNLILSLFKLLTGILASSGAMVSDAVHSASDVFSTLIVIAGVSVSAKKPDRQHPYGHERMECVASVILAVILAETGLGIGWGGVRSLLSGSYQDINTPGAAALVAAVVSVIVKEWMFRYTRKAAKKINCGALMADAWHHRTDALSSVGAFAGILGARMGFLFLEPAASVLIALMIIKAGIDIFKDAIDKMVDHSCDEETEKKIGDSILSVDGVLGIDDLKTRLFGAGIYADVEIAVDGSLSLKEAHEIAENVHSSIESSFPTVRHCMVHVNPLMESENTGGTV